MSWQRRLQEVAIAGGLATTTGCFFLPGAFCGNANPDPCICGRPEESARAKQECDEKKACEAAGGAWEPYASTVIDAGIYGPSCTFPQDARWPIDEGPDAGYPDAHPPVPDAQILDAHP